MNPKPKLTFNDLPEAVHFLAREISDLKEMVRGLSNPTPTPDNSAPFMSSAQVKTMTGWPDGTFYQKVGQMPEGVVIRGKSKRLLFDRAKFIAWLTDGTLADFEADNLPFGPTPKTKRRADL